MCCTYGAHDEAHHLFHGNACDLVCLYVITTKQYFVAGIWLVFFFTANDRFASCKVLKGGAVFDYLTTYDIWLARRVGVYDVVYDPVYSVCTQTM